MNQLNGGMLREYSSAALIILLGAGISLQSTSMPVGSLTEMGPGFFPLALGVMLLIIGLAMTATAYVGRRESQVHKNPDLQWRGWACITLGIVAFIVFGRYGGLVPATFAVVFISALGDSKNRLRDAFLLAATMVAVSLIVFWWALKIQFDPFVWG